MEHADHLKIQIARYERLLENLTLGSDAAAKVKVALRELEDGLRREGTAADWRTGALRTG